MRYHQINEAIVNQPRNLKKFCNDRASALRQINATATAAFDFIKQTEKQSDYDEAEYLLEYALRSLSDDRPMLPRSWSINLDYHYKIHDLEHSLESVAKFGANRFGGYVNSNISFISPMNDATRQTLEMMPHVEKGFIDYGFNPASETDEDYLKARRIADAYMVILKALRQLEGIIRQVDMVFKDISKRENYHFNPHKYKPDHDEVETLYHCSLFASDLVENGFQQQKPTNRFGVGNFGDQSKISFTHDIRIAHDIMRAFKEMWMIVHGQITRNQLVRWIHAEGIDLKMASSFYMSSKEPVTTVRQVLNLYKGYLGLNKHRTNPMIVNADDMIPALEKIDLDSIGIISCEVKLDDAEYLYGENEFRVSPDKIVGPVKRVH